MNKRHLLFVFLIFIFSNSLFAAVRTWDGGAMSNAWEDAANWDPNGVPISTDDVKINGAFTVTVSSTSTINSLELGGSANLTIANTYTLSIIKSSGNHDGIDLLDTGASLTINGTLISNGHKKSGIDVNPGCSLTINASGVVSVNGVEGNGINLRDNMVNSGVITITVPTGKDGIRMEGDIASRTVVNNGSITISGGTEYGIDQSQQNWLFTNNGTVTVSNAGVALVRDGTDFINNGTFKGNGLIQNGTNYDFSTQPGSTLAPGTSVGKLTFANKVDFSGINLNIEINGLANYDQVVVTSGAVKITGATINLSGGYVPVIGETFMILEKVSAGLINGTFSGVPSNFTISYTGGDGMNDVVLTFIGVPLPIELIDFSARAMENEVKLAWTTANETNNDYYTLERSLDGRTFEAIAMVNGNGNTSEISNYSHMDKNPRSGLNYYRLKQTDFDGQFSYSDIKTAELNYNGTIKVYPTAVTGVLTVETGADFDGDVTIAIRDLAGKEYKSFPVTSKSNKIELPMDDLIPGNYYVVIYNKETIHTQKIVKL